MNQPAFNPTRRIFPPRCRRFAAATLLIAAVASAQVAPPATTASDPAVQLSAFEVSAEKDLGYAASSALTGTRTNEKLENLPNSITVMTQEFLQDLAVNNFLDAVEYATNAENLFNDSGTRGAAIGQHGLVPGRQIQPLVDHRGDHLARRAGALPGQGDARRPGSMAEDQLQIAGLAGPQGHRPGHRASRTGNGSRGRACPAGLTGWRER